MSEQELVDVLSVHADSLKDGVDLTDELLAAKATTEGEVLESLLRLARQVKEALAPVAPRAEFVARLQTDLRREARRAAESRLQTANGERRRWIGIAAGLGALVYFAGLTWVSVKWSLTVFSFVAGLLGLKSVRSAGAAQGPRPVS